MSRVCVLLANGFEEIEAVTVIDVLRRAEVEVTTVGVDGADVEGSHGIRIRADRELDAAIEDDWDLVVLPGGMPMPGAATLRDDPRVQALIRSQHDKHGKIAAICAAPIALGRAGILGGRNATSYPGFEDQLPGANYLTERVVRDGTITTSRGPGTALEFALRLVADLEGADKASALAERMLVEVIRRDS
jgi:4-methyl-5(b-hydroxyethyl)-thiazole monophosphate biosynthesis